MELPGGRSGRAESGGITALRITGGMEVLMGTIIDGAEETTEVMVGTEVTAVMGPTIITILSSEIATTDIEDL